jgi:lipopolysaccharide transport system ATP-binding protein
MSYCRDFWALNDVSFEVKKGETVGIIGRNGSGKSTLLQLICGTLTPSAGSIETTGRVAALLELGSGFNPEFTGRENVYMNGAILGLTRDEIDARFDSIASFADIGEFIEQPVKTYSSGMLVRLAFAVSVCVEPDILIVDEALAVGDMNFQAKCITALSRIQEKGTTILFVSHDVGTIKSLCSRCIYLEHGKLKEIGPAPDVAELYVRVMREEMNAQNQKSNYVLPIVGWCNKENNIVFGNKGKTELKQSAVFDNRVAEFRYGSGGVRVTYVELLNAKDEEIALVGFDQEVKVRIYVKAFSAQGISVKFNVFDAKKINLTGCDFFQAGHEPLQTVTGGSYLVEYNLRLPLQDGNYSLRAQVTSSVKSGETKEFLDVIEDAVVFRVVRWEKANLWSKIHLFPKLNITKLD